MTSNIIEEWIKTWFRANALDPNWPDAMWAENYFEAGLLDSLSVVMMVEEIEAQFAITFPQEAFQDRRFSTMSGLAEIIGTLKERKTEQ